jgi:hypothetical protein
MPDRSEKPYSEGLPVSEEIEKILPSAMQGSFVSFVQMPTPTDKRLIVMLKDGSKRLVQCETCGTTEYMNVEKFSNPQSADRTRGSEPEKYYVRCHNPKCSGHGSGLFITAVSGNSEMFGRLKNRFRF